MTKELALLKEWKQRLGLRDWAIVLRINCKQEDMELEDVNAETIWTTSIKSATIKVISKEVYGERILPFDFEKTLVHELLHLKFGLIDQDVNSYEGKVAYEAMHQLIDDIARALVMAKRGKTKRELCYEEIEDYSQE